MSFASFASLASVRRAPVVLFLLLGLAGAELLVGESGYRHLPVGSLTVAASLLVGVAALLFNVRRATPSRRLQARLSTLQAGNEQLELEATNRTAQLKLLTHHLQTAREDERSRLARDLHDELGALLTSAKLDVARIKSRLGDKAPEAMEQLVHLSEMLNAGIALKRRIVEDLRPSALSHLGLPATLEILARDFAEQSGVVVHRVLDPVALAESAQLTLYRLLQEAITNIAKYARATQVWVRLSEEDGRVVLSVRDNGVGFDMDASSQSAYGLLGMRFRVEAEGGNLDIASVPSQGTLICARLPPLAEATGAAVHERSGAP